MIDREIFDYYKGFVAGWRTCNEHSLQDATYPAEAKKIAEEQLKRDLIEHSEIEDEEILKALMNDD
jgi:hypothetical protein